VRAPPPTPTTSAPPPAPTSTPPPAPGTLTERADYDPKRFDPVAYLPRARALAQRLVADARLTSFEFDPVYPDGRVDLTKAGRDREYIFRSPARSARPADVPRNVAVERACMIHVELTPTTITARIVTNDDCDAKLVRDPRCRFAAVWKQAIARGVAGDLVARIGWLFDEQWFFDVDLEGKGGGVSTLPDSCR